MAVLIFVCVACGIVELILLGIHRHRWKKRRQQTLKSLYKLMEERVLTKTLQNHITSEQAAVSEYQSPFLRIEFPDTKPWLANVFALDESITIGRSRENKVSIRDAELSRLHCKIALVNQNLYLQDLGSANGTAIRHGLFRKTRLAGQQTELLRDGDLILLSNYRMKLTVFYGREAAL